MGLYFTSTPTFYPCYAYSHREYKIQSAGETIGRMVDLLLVVTKYLSDKKDQFLSAPKALNQRSIVRHLKPSEIRSDRCALGEGAIEDIKKHAPITDEAKKQAIIEKQTKAYDIFNKIFDGAVYAVIPAIIVAIVAVIATVAAGLEMVVLGPLLAAVGCMFLALMITQAVSFSLLCRSHKKIDEDIANLIENQLSRMRQEFEVITSSTLNTIAYDGSESDNEKSKIVEILDKCNPINLVICIRDLNLARVHQSMDEYNKLIQSEITNTPKVIKLIDSELVNSFIIMLGSLFINDQNQECTSDYKYYISTLKADILALLNHPDVDILSPLVNTLSRRNASDTINNKDYSLLKQAIVAKLGTVTGADEHGITVFVRGQNFRSLRL